MKKFSPIFPLLFLIAIAGSAFTHISAQKSKTIAGFAYYQDRYGYCNLIMVNDPNCSPTLNGPVCQEFIFDNFTGWTTMYQFGTTTICWQPYYSLYPNQPF